jgi:hypothetical protein
MLVGLWAIFVSIVGLNGFAAGIVTVLYLWRRQQRRGTRVLAAVMLTALLPASLMAPGMLMSASAGATAPVGMLVGTAFLFAAAMVVSLPGALIVARKLEAPGDEFRAFE